MLVVTMLAGCDTEGEEISHSYTTYSVNVLYPENFSELDALHITLDGENILNTPFPGKNERNGLLEITYQDYIPLDTAVTLQPNQNLQILLLPGKVIELYDEESYITFTGSFIFDGYVAKLNGQELVNGLNYIRKDKAVGNLGIYEAGNDVPVAEIPVNIENGSNLNVMKLGDSFVEVPADTEPDPVSNKILKARFLYQGDETLALDEIRLDFYVHDDWCWAFFDDCVASVTLKKGEFSDYIELDLSFRDTDFYDICMDGAYGYSFYYDVIDPVTENILINHNDESSMVGANDFPSDGMTWTYKKGTFVLKDGGNSCDFESALSTPWE